MLIASTGLMPFLTLSPCTLQSLVGSPKSGSLEIYLTDDRPVTSWVERVRFFLHRGHET